MNGLIPNGLKVAIVWLYCLPLAALDLKETPVFLDEVNARRMPSVDQRLPLQPRVIDLQSLGRRPGEHGGTIRMLVGKQKDIRLIPYYSYTRLVGYDHELKLVPDVLESFRVKEGRIFTFKLRRGHKWSDGHPFTAEDFRYVWRDMFEHPDLSRGGLSQFLLVNGEGPQFDVLDEVTVRYSWTEPNPNFLPALAAANPLYLALPAHYLKQFHASYQDAARLAEMVATERVKNWHSLHIRKARMNKASNPELPVLDAWQNTVAPPSKLYLFKRNPYYHRVDENGRQLPYVDNIQITTVSKGLIPAKVAAGDVDLQARNLTFSDYTHLKEGEKRNDYRVFLWRTGSGSTLTLYPNLNNRDEIWRSVLRDVRFRRALSVAISRREINQVFYFGLARESANTVLPESPLFKEDLQNAWSQYDPELANRLLDEMGLERRKKRGYRHLPDGRLAEVIVETAGESTQQSDILELIADHWREVGIKLIIKNSQRDVLRRRARAGQTIMSVEGGLDNGLPSADMNPHELLPTSSSQLQWPQWGIYYETGGRKGIKVDLSACESMIDYSKEWAQADALQGKVKAWQRILQTYSDQVYSIGTVNGVPQPLVVSERLNNVPAEGIYAYEPMSFFGVYMPDTFWFDTKLSVD